MIACPAENCKLDAVESRTRLAGTLVAIFNGRGQSMVDAPLSWDYKGAAKEDKSMRIIELKVTLEDIQPSVMRILQVPDTIRLDRLHLTIQAAMGWTNSHLYLFCAGDPYEMDSTRWVLPDFAESPNELPADKTTLAEAVAATGSSELTYLYDFGDDWMHHITLGETRDAEPHQTYPKLTEAAGACPPEDVGGPPGYEMFVEAMADPKHPEHADLKQWYGGTFDPDNPRADVLRHNVSKLAKRWKTKK